MYNFWFKYILTFSSILFFQNYFSQSYNYKQFTNKNGLSNSCVYDICQDKDGFMWFATDNGLSRFDGSEFKNYYIADGLAENCIVNITEYNNYLLVSTYSKGLLLFDKKKTFTTLLKYTQQERIVKPIVLNDTLYGLINGEVCVVSLKNHNHKINIVSNNTSLFKSLCVGANNVLYCIDDNDLFELKGMNLIKIKNNLNSFSNFEILAYRNEKLYLAKKNCIYVLSQNKIIDSVKIQTESSNVLRSFFVDDTYKMWCSYFYPILNNVIDKHIVNDFSKLLNIERIDVNKFYQDNEGNVWLAICGKGVYCIKQTALNYYPSINTNYTGYVSAIASLPNGHVLLGTSEGFFIKDKLNTITHLTNNKREYIYGFTLKGKTVYFNSNASSTYSLCLGGINYKQFTSKCLKFTNDSQAYSANWMNGLTKFKINKSIQKIFTTSIKGSFDLVATVSKLCIINDSIILCGTDKGLYQVNSEDSTYKKINFISSNYKIQDIIVNNNKWLVGTNNGLAINDNGQWHLLKKINDKFIGEVKSLVFDINRNVYIGTLNGLFIITKNQNYILDAKTNLESSEINQLHYDSIINTLFIATNQGYYKLDITKYFAEKKTPPTMRFNYLKTDEQVLFVRPSQELILKSEQNNFSLHYVGITFTSPLAVIYRYKTNDGNWLYTKNKSIDFTKVPYGKHLITLQCSLDNVNWSNPLLISLVIKTPFYASNWFKIIAILLIIFILFILVRLRISVIRKRASQKLDLQTQLEDIKMQSLNASINPHFIFNALNSVQHYINKNDKAKASDFLGKFARLIRMVVDNVSEKEITIEDEILRMGYYLELEQSRFDNQFKYEISTQDELKKLLIPNMIIQPLVENAILHGVKNKTNGFIKINFKTENQNLIITISDNGNGFEESNKPTHDNNHKSFALTNIKSKLQLIPGSSIELTNQLDANHNVTGALVIIVLPLIK